MSEKIKIAIADDHLLVRQGLTSLLREEDDFNVIINAANGVDLLEQVEVSKPDVILLDIRMPVMDGHQTMAVLKNKYPEIKVIIISSHYYDAYIIEFIKAGASGFLPKNCDIEIVIEAICAVHEQGYYLDTKFSKSILEELLKVKSIDGDGTKLSDREITIAKLLCDENSTNDIANQLFISSRTVEWHKKNIFIKTKSKSVVGLVKYAIKNNLIENPSQTYN